MTSEYWDPIDDFFGDNEPTTAAYTAKNDNNEDELDQNELLGIDINEPFDDDFGFIDDKEETKPEIIKNHEKTIEINKTPVKNDIKTYRIENNQEKNEQIDEITTKVDEFFDKELKEFDNDEQNIYTDLKYEELDYDNLLDYGEDDDFEEKPINETEQKKIVFDNKSPRETRQKLETEQKKIFFDVNPNEPLKSSMPEPKPFKTEIINTIKSIIEPIKSVIEPIKSDDIIKKIEEIKPLNESVKPVQSNEFKLSNEGIAEDDLEDEEEDVVDGETKEKRGRSNHWSERAENKTNEMNETDKVNQHNYRNNNRQNYQNGNNNNNRNMNYNNNKNRNNNYNKNGNNFKNFQNSNNNNLPQGFNNNNIPISNNPGLFPFPNNQQNLIQQQQPGINNSAPLMSLNPVNNSNNSRPNLPNLPMNQMNQQQRPFLNQFPTPPRLNAPLLNNPIMNPQQQHLNIPLGQNMPQRPSFNSSQQQTRQTLPVNMNNNINNVRPGGYQSQMPFQNQANMNKISMPNNGYINPRTDLHVPMNVQNISPRLQSPMNNFNNNTNNGSFVPQGLITNIPPPQLPPNIQPHSQFNNPNNSINQQQGFNNNINNQGLGGQNNFLNANTIPQSNQQGFVPSNNNNQFVPQNLMPNAQNGLPQQNVHNQLPILKPSTVYINPSFIAKQKKEAEEAAHKKNLSANILKENNQTSKSNDSLLLPKKPSRKDLEALLEKRLLAELLEDHKQANSSPKIISPPVKTASKRKSSENHHKKNTDDRQESSKMAKRSNTSSNNRSDSNSTKKMASSKVASTVQKSTQPKKIEPKSIIIDVDPEYTKKLEEQNKKREELKRIKEEKRKLGVVSKKIDSSDKVSPPLTTTKQNNTRHIIVSSTKTKISSPNTSRASNPSKRVVTANSKPLIISANIKSLINKTLQESSGQNSNQNSNSINLKEKKFGIELNGRRKIK